MSRRNEAICSCNSRYQISRRRIFRDRNGAFWVLWLVKRVAFQAATKSRMNPTNLKRWRFPTTMKLYLAICVHFQVCFWLTMAHFFKERETLLGRWVHLCFNNFFESDKEKVWWKIWRSCTFVGWQKLRPRESVGGKRWKWDKVNYENAISRLSSPIPWSSFHFHPLARIWRGASF